MKTGIIPMAFIFAILLILMSCNKKQSNAFEDYYDQLLGIIEQNSVKKNDVNWSDIKREVKDSIKVFSSNDDLYRAIKYTLKLINDGHSLFVTSRIDSSNHSISRFNSDTIPEVEARIVCGDIGYLNLHGLYANDSLTGIYQMKVRKALLRLDSSSKLSGWIIDLRSHSGGKLPSESLGLSPLFEQPLIGISYDNIHSFKRIVCSNNFFNFGDIKLDSLFSDSILKNRHKKIAVLVGKSTVSAGEFLALAFKFQKNTKVFGSKTNGKTSHLRLFEFKSNARLLLAIGYYCDKDKKILRGGIIPDIACDSIKSLKMAVDWIKQPLQNK